MSYVKCSKNFLTGSTDSLMGRIVNLYSGSYSPSVGGSGGPQFGLLSQPPRNANGVWLSGNTGNLRIMAGSPPSNVNNLSNSTPPSGSSTIAQVLSLSTSGLFNPTGNNWYVNPTSISTIFLEATGNGIASWFWLSAMNSVSGGTVWHNIIGNVGLIGSGADMQVADLFISAGQLCRIVSLKLTLPPSFFD